MDTFENMKTEQENSICILLWSNLGHNRACTQNKYRIDCW